MIGMYLQFAPGENALVIRPGTSARAPVPLATTRYADEGQMRFHGHFMHSLPGLAGKLPSSMLSA
jgi:hypothetical protein